MKKGFEEKFKQCPVLVGALLATGTRELVYVSFPMRSADQKANRDSVSTMKVTGAPVVL
jgi:hypothetical protein